jgi:hypothetical protein
MSADFDRKRIEVLSAVSTEKVEPAEVAAVLTFQPGGWVSEHTIHFTGEGVELRDTFCFIPFVSKFMKPGDLVEFRIECAGVWGARLCGGGKIIESLVGEGTVKTPGIWVEFVYLDPKCREALLSSSVSGLSFPRA